MTLELTRRKFSVDEYYLMARAGILTEDDRVELIDGAIVEMTPIGARHAGCVAYLDRRFNHLLGERAFVWSQNPVRLDQHAEPEPDITLVRPRSDGYRTAVPTVADVFLIIEVGDTSIDVDRRIKAPLYARHGIPDYWAVDLGRDVIVVHRDPSPDGYRIVSTLRRGDSVAPLAFPDCELAVDDILGPR